MPIFPMTIIHSKERLVLPVAKRRHEAQAVLISLVWILRIVPATRHPRRPYLYACMNEVVIRSNSLLTPITHLAYPRLLPRATAPHRSHRGVATTTGSNAVLIRKARCATHLP